MYAPRSRPKLTVEEIEKPEYVREGTVTQDTAFLTRTDCQSPSIWSHFSSLCSSYKPIVEFIDAQFEAYLQEELKIRRVLHSYHDSRIHACLYFIAPTGHSLKSLDLVTMKKLDSKVWGRTWGCASWTLTDIIHNEYWIPVEVLWNPNPILCYLPLKRWY